MAGADLRPDFSTARAAFGVPATVTRPAPDDTPIDTEVIWLPPPPTDVPFGLELQRQEPKRILSIPLADVPTVPTGTLIACPEVLAGAVQQWTVDGFDRYEFDAVRVIVVPAEDAT